MGSQQIYRMQIGFSRTAKSETKFVLVHGQSKEEVPIRWHWLTQRFKQQQQSQMQETVPRLTYSQKKNLLCDLNNERVSSSSFKIRQGFSRRQKVRVASTAGRLMSTATSSRRSLQPFFYLNAKDEQLEIPTINLQAFREQLVTRVLHAKQNGRQLLVVLFASRTGLRYKLYHAYVEWCPCGKVAHGHQIRQVSEQVRQQVKALSRVPNELYYFTLQGSPLHNLSDITNSTVVLVDCVPKLHFSNEILSKIQKQTQGIHNILVLPASKIQQKTQEEREDTEEIYDWQRIKNAKQYVDRISQDPKDILQPKRESVSELTKWYNERFKEEAVDIKSKDTNKNPLFESKSHYPNQIVNKKLLATASEKLQGLETTKNRHKYIPGRLDLMMETGRREGATAEVRVGRQVQGCALGKKHLLKQLDRKNSLLSTQNIPYLIEKYGLNRFQVYNLYNLYKSFQKVSILRQTGNEKEVLTRGVDRETFEAGLKGLDMNPGQQLIRNICYFGDFISWQQFIKIISISLRKTPEQKLTAILKGISSSQQGFLTRHQISLMIGNSLQKLFDREEPQLREYFTGVAMRELGGVEGKVAMESVKEKVLGRGSDNLTMVSFLILNT